jgi:hypothetical protein
VRIAGLFGFGRPCRKPWRRSHDGRGRPSF